MMSLTHYSDAPSFRQITNIVCAAGAALSGRTTGQPVRRNSRHAGEREILQWKISNVFGAREKRALLKAAKRYERKHKEAGRRIGPLGHVAIELYELLLDMRDYKTGRLDPAIATLAAKLRRSVAAVCAAKERLKAHGFLNWDRRTEPTNDPDGPQVKQISNAYFIGRPADVAREVQRELACGPTPPDAAHHRDEQAAQLHDMLARASSDEVTRFWLGTETDYARSLAELGRAVDRRDRDSTTR